MGETDEFVPQSSHVEDESEQKYAAEESAVSMTDEPSEDVQPEATAVAVPAVTTETDELDEISQSLSDDASTDAIAENADGDVTDADPASSEEASADASPESGPDSFDDIAAPAPGAAADSHVPEPSAAAGQVPWWPFMVYLGAWVILAAAAVWQLLKLPADQVVYESTAYVLTILGGLVMTAMGPLLILAVWLGTRAGRVAQEREGLLTSALMKGALVTLGGAIIWWASLVIIDYLRLGRLL